MKTVIALCCGALLALSASEAAAIPITLPPGLSPGDHYFLVFVTSGTRDGTSTNIGDYDAFVSAQANMAPELAALSTTWSAIGSTSSVSALTHIGVTGPVYRLDGQQVATGSADMFDGSIINSISIDQFGNNRASSLVWTGTTGSGMIGTPLELGSLSGPVCGLLTATGGNYLSSVNCGGSTPLPLYGVSAQLEVPMAEAQVPEPGTFGLMLLPAIALLRRRYGRPRAVRSHARPPARD